MKTQLIGWIAIVFMAVQSYAQLGISHDSAAPHPSAMLDVHSDSKGFLPPRMNTAQRDAILEPAQGLIIFNIDCNDIQFFDGSHFIPLGNTGMLANPGPITGNTSVCEGYSGEVFSISTVPNATGYHWNVPPGAIISSGQGTTTITVSFQTLGGVVCVSAFNDCYRSEMSCQGIDLQPILDAAVSVVPSVNPVCPGTTVTFTATPQNGGVSPQYVWKVNGSIIPGAESNILTMIPAGNDQVQCEMTSSEPCISLNPVLSNTVIMEEMSAPSSPQAGTHVPAQTQITWNWTAVSGANGYKWNDTNDYASATDMGTATSKTETGLICNTVFSRYVWSYNSCGNSAPVTLSASTLSCWNCGDPLAINHVAGAVAPVNKSVTYGTVANIPGEPGKCWITRNLGASQQAPNVWDATEASAGWYWQFNLQQGYKHDGTTRTPNTAWIGSINANSNWLPSNDPCTIEMGAGWRIPTSAEWYNVDNVGGWIDRDDPWESNLKLHCAGYLNYTNALLSYRGTNGIYWSSTQHDNTQGKYLYFFSTTCYVWQSYKSFGITLRCISDL